MSSEASSSLQAAMSAGAGVKARSVSLDEAIAFGRGAQPDGAVVWVNVQQPTSEVLLQLETGFSLHPLTIEDLVHRNQRAKIEEFDGYLFIVFHWFRTFHEDCAPCELHCILGPNFLITVSEYGDIAPLDVAWKRFEQGVPRPPYGAEAELYRVLDEVVDGHKPRLVELEDKLEALDDRVEEEHVNERSVMHEITAVRRRLVEFRRLLAPERDVLNALSRRDFSLVSPRMTVYLRDVYDHINRTYEAVEALRELTEAVMEVQLASNERRTNQIIKRLTVISTIFLPLNFVTGFFGMNFTHMPFDSTHFMLAAISAMVVLPTAFLMWFYLKKWV